MQTDAEIRLPADSAYVAVLRITTAGLAARLDFTLDDIEDLRIAVDEACALLLPHAVEGAELDCRFELATDALSFSVTVATSDPAPLSQDSFAWTVLNALAGDVKSTADGDLVTVSLVKHRGVAPA
jgi:serine/threonine-protein kinase RsbW